ncbi:MAG: DUF3047 domain-containing protein [Deltaproteobacteria bacterium]|nr:DUF3047 domain-containing protein [Deltaproteobacteria bacterium]
MKRTVTLIVSLLLFMAFIPAAGCKKAEEPKKPEVSVLPTAPVPPGISTPPSSPEKPESPAAPSATVTSVPPTTPAPGEPAVAPPGSVTPAKPADKDSILVAGFNSAQMEKGAPTEWLLDRRRGTPFLKLEKGSEGYCLHMRSNNESSFGVKRGIKVDIKEYPYLHWRWKVDRLPDGGDVRKTDTDDQAVQLYVAFTPTGFPAALNTPVLGYIWDNEAPKGWTGRSKQIGGGKLKYVVVRNKTDQLGQWYTEKRNIYEDSKKLLKESKGGETPGLTHGVQFYINSQNTRSAAESYICEVYFSKN